MSHLRAVGLVAIAVTAVLVLAGCGAKGGQQSLDTSSRLTADQQRVCLYAQTSVPKVTKALMMAIKSGRLALSSNMRDRRRGVAGLRKAAVIVHDDGDGWFALQRVGPPVGQLQDDFSEMLMSAFTAIRDLAKAAYAPRLAGFTRAIKSAHKQMNAYMRFADKTTSDLVKLHSAG